MQKVRYELDPYNRLVLEPSGRNSDLPKSRRVLDGRFRLGANNDLSYHVKAPFAGDETVPNQFKLKGQWSLTDDHDLRLTLNKSARRTFGDQLTLQGEILDVKANSLLFAVTSKTKDDTQSTYILNFSGAWTADERNRLSFHIRRESGRYDILTFNLAWQINKDHEIIYEYEKARLLRKRRQAHTLTFRGHWDIRDKFRISYLLDGSTDSAFTFRTSAGVFKEGYIKYEAAISLARRLRPVRRIVALSGKWKLKKGVGLLFEVEYENGSKRAIIFGFDAKLGGNKTVIFKLKTGMGKNDIGAGLELSRSIISGDGEAFLRASASRRESALYAGAAFRW